MGKHLKKTNKRYWKNKCKVVFAEIVRMEGKCVVCNSKKGLHCSHIINVSQSEALRFDFRNALCMCHKHHIYWWHKNPLEATKWFKEKYPGNYKFLMLHRHDMVKRNLQDYIDLYEQLKSSWSIGRKTRR